MVETHLSQAVEATYPLGVSYDTNIIYLLYLEMICCASSDIVLYDLPGERTGRHWRLRIHGERLELSAIVLDKPEGTESAGEPLSAERKIHMNIIIDSLRQTIGTIKKDLPQKKLFRSLCANVVIYKSCKALYDIDRIKLY